MPDEQARGRALRIGGFEFSMRELAGSMGDFGTLLPLVIGYISVCGMDPTGLLVMMGAVNIATGLIYRLPMPLEPMKVLAALAISGGWSPEKVHAAAFAMGVVWLLLGAGGVMTRVARRTPETVVRGIQLSLGALLALKGLEMMSEWWVLGLGAVVVVILLRDNPYVPAALVLVGCGVVVIFLRGDLQALDGLSPSLPPLISVRPRLLLPALRDAGLAQIPLTATNAVIATTALISEYWPERRVTERQLSINMGVMNLAASFFGGMPMCHGAGGLAGQYHFGARTGGANIIEGTIELALGLLLGGSIAALFSAFPVAIVGAMMLAVGGGLFGFARDLSLDSRLAPVAATIAGSLAVNMAVGFLAGWVAHYLTRGMPGDEQ